MPVLLAAIHYQDQSAASRGQAPRWRALPLPDAAGRSREPSPSAWQQLAGAARTPERVLPNWANVSAARMAWCPPELRDQARYLTNTKRIPAADVRRMILEQYEADMKRFSERLVAYG